MQILCKLGRRNTVQDAQRDVRGGSPRPTFIHEIIKYRFIQRIFRIFSVDFNTFRILFSQPREGKQKAHPTIYN